MVSEVNPKVESILESARERNNPESEVNVEARSFQEHVKKKSERGLDPVISEIKPTSPTTEEVKDFDSQSLAKEMEGAGAAAISVLTEEEHFGGSPDMLKEVREAVDLPVLRKDFVLNEEELDRVEADLVLLIARFLDDLDRMIEVARGKGFQVLVEVHTEEEMEEAIDAGAEIIGINNRDLSLLEVDLNTFENLVDEAPQEVTLVAESGIQTREDAERMMKAGADAMLIGKAVMRGNVRENVREFANKG
jgi:indole-3-glycerol phosphate synthase